jgi:hypothetical protein
VYVYCINLLSNLAATNPKARKEILNHKGLEVFGFSLEYFTKDSEYFETAVWFLGNILQKLNSCFAD